MNITHRPTSVLRTQEPPFNFCSRTWATDEPCEDYADTGGEHLCGENAHVSGHVHTCSCTAEQR